MQNYMRLPGGAVCTAVEATDADLKGLDPHYARLYIPAGARVRVVVEVDKDQQLIFDGLISPESKKAALFEIRVRRHADVEAVPGEPTVPATKAEAEAGM